MLDKININIKKTLLAFIICLVAIPLARFISPQTIIDGNLIYIAWLPISVMFSVIFIFGRYAIAPLILAFAITNSFLIKLTLPQAFILLCVFLFLRLCFSLLMWYPFIYGYSVQYSILRIRILFSSSCLSIFSSRIELATG